MADDSLARLIAFYLPQFHPTDENDRWWGKGYTEWRRVASAKPAFPGHYQPHIPADLGFYDLRVPEARQAQAELAADHGIFGFCYYHYWFNGRILLGRPLREVLECGRPTLPFCLCWANEDWTRAWDGRTGERLTWQEYSEEDDRRHLRWLAPAFEDDRYIRVGGRPLFLVYRAQRLPDPVRTTTTWREEAEALGLGQLFLCRVESFPDEHDDPVALGFDAAVEFQPDWARLGPAVRRQPHWRLLRKVGLSSRGYGEHAVLEYRSVVERMLGKLVPDYRRFPCVTPSWDNTPRRSTGAVILDGSTPGEYERWLGAVLAKRPEAPADEDLVFVNAWNEWGEGNHLEPCQRWGRSYLEATARAHQTTLRRLTAAV